MGEPMFFIPDHRAEKHQRPAELHTNVATVNDMNLFIGTLSRPHVNTAAKKGDVVGVVQVQFGENGPTRVIGNVTFAPDQICKIPSGSLTVRFGISKDLRHTATEIDGRTAYLGPWIPEKPVEVQVIYVTEKTRSPPMFATPFEFTADHLSFLRLLVEGKAMQAFRNIASEEYERNSNRSALQLTGPVDRRAAAPKADRAATEQQSSPSISANSAARHTSPRSMIKNYNRRKIEGKRHGPSTPTTNTPESSPRTDRSSRLADVLQPPAASSGPEPKRLRNGGGSDDLSGEAPFRLVPIKFTDSGPTAASPVVDLSVSSLDISSEGLDTIDKVYGLDDQHARTSEEAEDRGMVHLGEYRATIALQALDDGARHPMQGEASRDPIVAAAAPSARTTARTSTGGLATASARPDMSRVLYDIETEDLLYPAGTRLQQHEDFVKETVRGDPAARERRLHDAAELEKLFIKKAGFTTLFGVHRRFAHAPAETMEPFMAKYEFSRVLGLPWTTSCGSCRDVQPPDLVDDAGYPVPHKPAHIINLIVMGVTPNGPGYAFFTDEQTSFILMWEVQTNVQLARATVAAFRYFARALDAHEGTRYLRAPAVLKQATEYQRFLDTLGVKDADELLNEKDRERIAGVPIIRVPGWGTLRLPAYLAYRARCVYAEPTRVHGDLQDELLAIVRSHNTCPFGESASPQVRLHGIVDDRWPFIPRETVLAYVKSDWVIAKFQGFGRDFNDYIVTAGGRTHRTHAIKPCDGANASTPQ